ncbi:Dual specificity protein phosphatase 23 [Geodia barretti]|uniref:Dual specificity protein phosphatase 23 n=1 Tax=Geodia barretti TaxID=519541 RepID=A0AA35RBQ6_GEOBA|nr:Dual specificity protein phosphatase 23 [Geodia barretti]
MGPTSRRDLIFFQRQDIRAVLRMEESTISAEIWNMYDMFEPVPDFTAPTLEQIDRMARWIEEQIENYERPVVVTCHAGIGRTGTMLAAYMVYMGYEPQAAIDHVREQRPGSIETPEQQQAVFDYAEHRRVPVGPVFGEARHKRGK